MIRVQYYNNPSSAIHHVEILRFDKSPWLFSHSVVDQSSPLVEKAIWLLSLRYLTRRRLSYLEFAPLKSTPLWTAPLRLLHLKSKSLWTAPQRLTRIEQLMLALRKRKPELFLGHSLGDTLCAFLSLSEIDCNNFFEPYKDDLPGYNVDDTKQIHRIFNELISKNMAIADFQYFMAKNKLIMPQHRYIEDVDGSLTDEYTCSSILEICTVSFYKVLESKHVFRRCQNDQCQSWFVPRNKSDEKYCDNLSPQYPEKSCKEAMKLIKVLNKRHDDEVTRKLKNIRQMYYNEFGMKVNANGENKDEFENSVRQWRNKMKNGQATEEQFIKYLESCYKRNHKQH